MGWRGAGGLYTRLLMVQNMVIILNLIIIYKEKGKRNIFSRFYKVAKKQHILATHLLKNVRIKQELFIMCTIDCSFLRIISKNFRFFNKTS